MTIKIVCVIGTRPEVIKMASVIQALYKNSFFKLTILATAQHRELLDEALDVFNIKPDVDLNIMSQNQSLGDLTGRLLINLSQTLKELSPEADMRRSTLESSLEKYRQESLQKDIRIKELNVEILEKEDHIDFLKSSLQSIDTELLMTLQSENTSLKKERESLASSLEAVTKKLDKISKQSSK